MAEDILDEIDDDFDDEAMKDMLDDASAYSSEDAADEKKESSEKKMMAKLKEALKKSLGSKKTIMIIAISLVLILGSVVGVWFSFFKGGPEKVQDIQNTIVTGEEMNPASTRQEQIVFEDIVDLEPFERIRLKSSSTMRLISMNLSLELTDHRFRKQVYTMEDRIRNIITGQVEEMTWLELRNPEGKIMLKYNLLKRINSIFPKATVRNIYFTYFIMQ